jgi:hypothetical protein
MATIITIEDEVDLEAKTEARIHEAVVKVHTEAEGHTTTIIDPTIIQIYRH